MTIGRNPRGPAITLTTPAPDRTINPTNSNLHQHYPIGPSTTQPISPAYNPAQPLNPQLECLWPQRPFQRHIVSRQNYSD